MIFNAQGPQGPDVSFYQDDDTTPQQINFPTMFSAGAEYVIVRAGQNLWIDPDFKENWRRAKEAGLPRGSYWFYDSRADPIEQATIFAGLFFNDAPELELWLDLEENYNGTYKGYTHWKKFLNRLKQLLPHARIGIYTGYGYINGKIPISEYYYFSQYVLWLAWYTKNEFGKYHPYPSYVKIPVPWTTCLFWQWGTPSLGIQWGCESIEIDMNLFNGTREEFYRRYNLSAPNPLPIGEPMYFKATTTVNIRSSAAVPIDNSNDLGTFNLLTNDIVEVDDVAFSAGTITWRKLRKIWRNNQPVTFVNSPTGEYWVAEKNATTVFMVQTNFTPPITAEHVVEVYVDGVLEYRREF